MERILSFPHQKNLQMIGHIVRMVGSDRMSLKNMKKKQIKVNSVVCKQGYLHLLHLSQCQTLHLLHLLQTEQCQYESSSSKALSQNE